MSNHRVFRLMPLLAAALGSGPAWCADFGFEPASLDFGSLAPRETKRQQAELRNTSATAIVLTGQTIEGPGAAAFTLSAVTCGDTLAAGTACVYSITYRSPSLAPQKARLVVRAAGQPATVLPLSGNVYAALNDTGLTRCVTTPATPEDSLLQPCPGSGFPGQDGDYGRDRKRNQNDNGQAGFNFTKLDGNGKEMGSAAKVWKCVRDNVTGLVWETKPVANALPRNQGLHDPDDTYTWYSTDAASNGGAPGEANPGGNTCFGYDAADSLTWCNTESYVYRVNRAGYCGFKDWRLPSRGELAGLEHLGNLRIDLGYFQDTRADNYWYTWTASPYALGSDRAWFIDFTYGVSDTAPRGESQHIRLVRGGR